MKIFKILAVPLILIIGMLLTAFSPSPDVDSRSSVANAEPGDSTGQIPVNSSYVVFAWNDLGMHCANPSYDVAVLLPPYNTLWAQVVKRGNPPQIVTQNVTVNYRFINNTYSYGKGKFGQFWDNIKALFGMDLEKDKGLNLSDPNVHNGLAGTMVPKSDHFEVVGVPLTPIDDSNNWNPYQVAEITVQDSNSQTIAQTRATAPVSDEINCAKCHGSDAFNDILNKHDQLSGTTLQSQKPVLCASCHGDPALGNPVAGPNHFLSESIHGFHGNLANPPSCYDCHPGQTTQCSRSIAHTASDGNCTTCHGSLMNVSSTIDQGRIPWANEPKCVACHTGVAQVDTGSVLYRNSAGHGGIYCASCHSSPHAMIPTNQPSDNYQALQYQGQALPIGDCAACHVNSKGGGEGGLGEYLEEHGGANPENPSACNICHTAVNTVNTSQWPHSFQWKMQAGISTTTVLTSSTNPSASGQSVTFTARVTAIQTSTDTPSGTVTFTDGITSLATVPLASSGKATCTTSALSVGSHNITAEYSGDFNFNGGISNPLSQVVTSTLDIVAGPLNDGEVKIDYAETLQVINGAAPYKWSVVSPTRLPAGLRIQAGADTSSASILGKPARAGTFAFQIRVTDKNKQSTNKDFILRIIPAVTMAVARPPAGDIGVEYILSPTAAGGTGPGTYHWSITRKALPPGLILDEGTGKISGEPTTPGTYAFTLTVADDPGSRASKSLSIKVNKDLVITTSSLKEAKVGKSYSMSLKASGGSGKYTWYLAAGSDSWPAWVDQDKFKVKGIIAPRKGVKPDVAGTYNLKFEVQDSLGDSAVSQNLVLTVK